MKTTFAVSGFKDLEQALGELKDKATARRVADRALRKAAEPIATRAIELAPDDPATGTGKYLRAAIKIGRAGTQINRMANSGNAVVVFIGIDGSVLPPKTAKTRKRRDGSAASAGGGVAQYSIFTELGTSTHKAQPFMRPAWEQQQGVALARLADDLRAEIKVTADRAARKAARAGK